MCPREIPVSGRYVGARERYNYTDPSAGGSRGCVCQSATETSDEREQLRIPEWQRKPGTLGETHRAAHGPHLWPVTQYKAI